MTLLDALHAEIVDVFGDDYGAALITGYALLVQFVDRDGEPRMFTDSLEGQTASATLGLLVAGAITQAGGFARQTGEP